MLIWVFAVLMWCRNISHVEAHFLQQAAKSRSGCARWACSYGYSLFSCDVEISLMLRRIFYSRQRSPDPAARDGHAHMGIRGSHVM